MRENKKGFDCFVWRKQTSDKLYLLAYFLKIQKILHKSFKHGKHDFIYRYERIMSARSDLLYLLDVN